MILRYLFLGAFYANDKEMLLLRLNYIKITSVCSMFIHVILQGSYIGFPLLQLHWVRHCSY